MTSPDTLSAPRPSRGGRILVLLPLLGFFGLAALFFVRLGAGDPSIVPSPLIGRPVPSFALAPLPGLATSGPPGLASTGLAQGHVTVLNVFASWCVECHDEHDALIALAADPDLKARSVEIDGLVYKDDPENARRYLGAKGNPFARVGVDPAGRTGIDLGVYGVPETFVVRGDGTVAYKLVGAVTPDTRPALIAAIAAAAAPR